MWVSNDFHFTLKIYLFFHSFHLHLNRETGRDHNRFITLDLKCKCGFTSQAGREAVTQKMNKISYTLPPLSGSQISFICIEFLIEGKDIPKYRRSFQQSDARVVSLPVCPGCENLICV